jgi:hypothetical protein
MSIGGMMVPHPAIFWALLNILSVAPEGGCFISAQGWYNPAGYRVTYNSVDVRMWTREAKQHTGHAACVEPIRTERG